MRKKIVFVILILAFIFGATFAGIQIIREHSENIESSDSYTELEKYVNIPEASIAMEELETNLLEPEDAHISRKKPTIDFNALMAINQDCIGWICIPETEINYPIVQGSDNSYYLKHLFNGQWNNNGCIFLDCRVNVSLSDRHSIIYGHHMKNGTMFSELAKYKKQEYFENHPTGLLITPDVIYQIDFFAGYVVDTKDNAWNVSFQSDEGFETWIKEIKQKSCVESSLYPAVTDRILTLSTCSYEFDNARFVLHGRISKLVY